MRQISLRRFSASFQHAMEGVLDAYRSQRHMRVHFVFMASNAVLALIYKLNAVEVALVTVATALVVSMEMMNTVVEAIINLVCETYHPVARFAKDVAAGAVLVAAGNAVIVAICIYGNPERLGRLRDVWLTGTFHDESAQLRALAMTLVLLTTLLAAIKVGRPEASVVHGGTISGHAAYAFCMATCVYFLVGETAYAWLATAMAIGVALIVAHLRLSDHSHRMRTVFYGAALGIIVPLVVFGLLAQPQITP